MDPLEPIYSLANAHHQDLLHLAQQKRRVCAGQAPLRPHHRALAWLGDRLIACGQSLRERYSAATPSPMPPPSPNAQQTLDILL